MPTPTLQRDLMAVTTELAQAQADLQRLLRAPVPDPARIAELNRQIERLSARQQQLLTRFTVASRDPSAARARAARPQREHAIDLLGDLGEACPTALLGDVARAIDGQGIPATNFGSILRAEQVAYDRDPARRPVWLTYGLNAGTLTAARRWLALSTFPPEQRVVAAATSRAAALRVLRHVTVRHGAAVQRGDDDQAGRLETLAQRLCASLPFLRPRGTTMAEIAARARDELMAVEPGEAVERRAAVERLAALPPREQVWGLEPPAAVPLRGGRP